MSKFNLKLITIILLLPIFIFVGIDFYFLVSALLNADIEEQDILSLLLESLSLITTIILSVIAILQTNKINTIEENEYDFFIAVKEIDRTIRLGEHFIVPYKKFNTNFLGEQRFSITHSIYDEKTVYFTFINLADKVKEDNIISIPLKIITKNKLLITEIKFEKINICIKYNGLSDSFTKSLKGFGSTLSGVYVDESIISLSLGLCLPNKSNCLCTIDLEMFVQLRDQYGKELLYALRNEILHNEQGSFLISGFTSKVDN